MKRLLTLIILTAFLSSCAPSTHVEDLTSVELPAKVEVTFNALLPENTPSGELVLFTIVDDVTGVDYNLQRSLMEPSGARSFTVTLSVPAGTLHKYRYTRQAAAGNVEETTASGAAISFREYLVDGPGHIANDLIANWADTTADQPTGQISGAITAGSGLPLPNLIVDVSGIQTTTDGEGHFSVAGLPQGLHNVVVTSPDGTFASYQQGALVAAGNETRADMQLTGTTFAAVTFNIKPTADAPSAVPTFTFGNLAQIQPRQQLAAQPDGTYKVTLQLPTGVDIRYKYTLGDGFWNAEHASDGSFVLRQLIIPVGTAELTVDDNAGAWTSGTSAAIWFDLTAPVDSQQAYLQFKLSDWTTPLAMWALGSGHFAYVLYGPTNFSAPLEYRYCADAACTILEPLPGTPRFVNGNQPSIQQVQDKVDSWLAR